MTDHMTAAEYVVLGGFFMLASKLILTILSILYILASLEIYAL